MPIVSKEFIIVVEDDASLREEILISLRLANFFALGAADGKQLTELMARNKVDIVVLDLVLPGETGLAIAGRLRLAEKSVGIIMYTGKGLLQDRVLGLHAGADAYLVKPVDPLELIATIKALRRRLAEVPNAREKDVTVVKKNKATSKVQGELSVSTSGLRLYCPDLGTEMVLSDLQRRFVMCFKDAEQGQLMTREYLMNALDYGTAEDEDFHRLETLISRFRLKARAELGVELPIQAVPKMGYTLNKVVHFQ
jgi:DNA-binding response OmpR family regulator